MKIKIKELKEKVMKTLMQNFSKEEAERISEYLIWAEMCGIKTQGLLKLIGDNPLQKIKPLHKIKIEKDTKLSQVINAGAMPAPLVSQIATDNVIEKAKAHGFGIVAVHNIFSSNGAQGFYVERIAKENLIGIMCSRSPASVAAFDGIDPVFGTNPIGFGFPTNDEPIVFDMATSAMTWYGLVLAKARGEKIPENVAIDNNGKITTIPDEAMKGALLPFDKSYKGSGIAMIIEILAGPLASSAWVDNKTFKEEWGTLLIAIDPNLLTDVKKFKENCSDLVKKVKSSRKKEGINEIKIPGEDSRKSYQEALKTGFIEVDELILKGLGYI